VYKIVLTALVLRITYSVFPGAQSLVSHALSSAHHWLDVVVQRVQDISDQSHKAPNEGGLMDSPDLVPHNDTESINAAKDETIQPDAISVGRWAGVVLVEEANFAPDAGLVFKCCFSCPRQVVGPLRSTWAII
jgi:hypothetical protein